MINIRVVYLKLASFEEPIFIVQRANLISQEEEYNRVVMYSDTLRNIIAEWNEEVEYGTDENFNYLDMLKLEKALIDNDDDGSHTGADWYIFD